MLKHLEFRILFSVFPVGPIFIKTKIDWNNFSFGHKFKLKVYKCLIKLTQAHSTFNNPISSNIQK